MFDLNAIVSAALNAAVAEAIKPLVERIEKLEAENKAYDSLFRAQEVRVEALENNPAIGVDTTLEQRVVALEQRMDHVIDASEKRIREIAEAAAEQVMDLHLECYDHDQYDDVVSNWNDEDPTEFVRESDLDSKVTDAVSDALSNATVSISI
jgi:hypothetical protein